MEKIKKKKGIIMKKVKTVQEWTIQEINITNEESIKKNQKHALQEYGQKKHKTFQEKKRSLKKILIFETY